MSFLSVLKAAGTKLEDVGKWIDQEITKFAPAAEAATAILAPQITPIVSTVETVTMQLAAAGMQPSQQQMQTITQAVASLETIIPGVLTPSVTSEISKAIQAAYAVKGSLETAPASPIPAAPAPVA